MRARPPLLRSETAPPADLPRRSCSALQAVETDLKGVQSTVGKDAKIHEFLSNPVLSAADKSAGIDALLKAASPKGASDLTRNLFQVLSENGRLYETDKVVEGFLEIMSAHRGEVKVVITSAVPLEKDLQKRLEDSLKSSQLAAAGKSLIFENRVNEAVLGGLVVDVADKTVDLSVASRVSRLNAALAGASPLQGDSSISLTSLYRRGSLSGLTTIEEEGQVRREKGGVSERRTQSAFLPCFLPWCVHAERSLGRRVEG